MFVSWIRPLNRDEVGKTSLEEGSLYVGAYSPKGRMLRGNTSVLTIKNLWVSKKKEGGDGCKSGQDLEMHWVHL